MISDKFLRTWLAPGLLALFLSACATSQNEVLEDGPPPGEDLGATTGMVDDDATMGAETSGLSDDDMGAGTAIVEESMMTPLERLEMVDGELSNRTIYFEYDSAKLSDESIALLETHGNFIAGSSTVNVRLEGHADERGSREYNIALGDRRAQSVRRVLLFQGAAVDQVDTVSYGEEQPAVEGHDEAAWSKNRRVELIYTVN
ncbi:MAG: peptidoglycan-associated lipoprotein Pal [Gammaproteobacteria bacterium]|nr:peptidoglycan-associated lipoprotein Pal [Gammaproteobacteria bacterium]